MIDKQERGVVGDMIVCDRVEFAKSVRVSLTGHVAVSQQKPTAVASLPHFTQIFLLS